MKIFISWSGERSRAVAKALNDWLPKVIQAVKPFYSPEIEKGATWSNKIDEALEGTSFGIICLTPDNLDSKWIHFESGALFKTPNAKIWTFLHGIKNEDVPPPLSKFQHTHSDKSDALALVKSININLKEVGGEPLPDNLLVDMFDTFWGALETKLKEAEKLSAKTKNNKLPPEPRRDQRDILGEILEIVRNQQRQLDRLNRSPKNVSALYDEYFSEPLKHYEFVVDKYNKKMPAEKVILSFSESLTKSARDEISGLFTVYFRDSIMSGMSYEQHGEFIFEINFSESIDRKLFEDAMQAMPMRSKRILTGYAHNPV